MCANDMRNDSISITHKRYLLFNILPITRLSIVDSETKRFRRLYTTYRLDDYIAITFLVVRMEISHLFVNRSSFWRKDVAIHIIITCLPYVISPNDNTSCRESQPQSLIIFIKNPLGMVDLDPQYVNKNIREKDNHQQSRDNQINDFRHMRVILLREPFVIYFIISSILFNFI